MYPIRDVVQYADSKPDRFPRVTITFPYLRNSIRRQILLPPRRVEVERPSKRMLLTPSQNDPTGGVPAMISLSA